MHTQSWKDYTDAVLVGEMRRGDAAAWGAFIARFEPILFAYAKKSKIPEGDWPQCVTDVLDDEGLRLSENSATALPTNLAAYLIGAVRHRYLRLRRSDANRDRNYAAASEHLLGHAVVASACSEASLRSSAGQETVSNELSQSLQRLIHDLRSALTAEEELILVWTSEGVPHRQIALWLGTSYDACTKRIWRLCRRLRSQAVKHAEGYSLSERVEIDRFVRRAAAVDWVADDERPEELAVDSRRRIRVGQRA